MFSRPTCALSSERNESGGHVHASSSSEVQTSPISVSQGSEIDPAHAVDSKSVCICSAMMSAVKIRVGGNHPDSAGKVLIVPRGGEEV